MADCGTVPVHVPVPVPDGSPSFRQPPAKKKGPSLAARAHGTWVGGVVSRELPSRGRSPARASYGLFPLSYSPEDRLLVAPLTSGRPERRAAAGHTEEPLRGHPPSGISYAGSRAFPLPVHTRLGYLRFPRRPRSRSRLALAPAALAQRSTKSRSKPRGRQTSKNVAAHGRIRRWQTRAKPGMARGLQMASGSHGELPWRPEARLAGFSGRRTPIAGESRSGRRQAAYEDRDDGAATVDFPG